MKKVQDYSFKLWDLQWKLVLKFKSTGQNNRKLRLFLELQNSRAVSVMESGLRKRLNHMFGRQEAANLSQFHTDAKTNYQQTATNGIISVSYNCRLNEKIIHEETRLQNLHTSKKPQILLFELDVTSQEYNEQKEVEVGVSLGIEYLYSMLLNYLARNPKMFLTKGCQVQFATKNEMEMVIKSLKDEKEAQTDGFYALIRWRNIIFMV